MNRYNHANESAESKITPGAILPSSESAEELAGALYDGLACGIWGGKYLMARRPLEDKKRAAALIAAHDAETLRKAADRYCQYKCAWPSGEWEHSDQCECTERAAILGEGKA